MATKLTPINAFITKFVAVDYGVVEVICKDNKPFVFILLHKNRNNLPAIRIKMMYMDESFLKKNADGDQIIRCDIAPVTEHMVVTPDAKELIKDRIMLLSKEMCKCLSLSAKSVTN
jgi:hypothetical protein